MCRFRVKSRDGFHICRPPATIDCVRAARFDGVADWCEARLAASLGIENGVDRPVGPGMERRPEEREYFHWLALGAQR